MAKRFNKNQIEALIAAFEESEHLTKQKKVELGISTGLDVEQISSWYSRRRSKRKAGDLNSEFKRANFESEERETRLQMELQESKKRLIELEAENHHLRQQLESVGRGCSNSDVVPSRGIDSWNWKLPHTEFQNITYGTYMYVS